MEKERSYYPSGSLELPQCMAFQRDVMEQLAKELNVSSLKVVDELGEHFSDLCRDNQEIAALLSSGTKEDYQLALAKVKTSLRDKWPAEKQAA